MAINKEMMGKRIRQQREKLSLGKDEFAQMIQIPPRFLTAIENGTKGISAETLYKICEKTHVTADFFLFGRQPAAGLQTPSLEMLSSLPPEYSSIIEELLQALFDAIQEAAQNHEPG